MTQTFFIPGTLPGLNELISANRRNKYEGAKLKKDAQEKVILAAKQAGIKPVKGQYRLSITWQEPNKRRDPDNVFSAVKYINDALHEAGITQGDGWKYVSTPVPVLHFIFCDPAKPGVQVDIDSHEEETD